MLSVFNKWRAPFFNFFFFSGLGRGKLGKNKDIIFSPAEPIMHGFSPIMFSAMTGCNNDRLN